MAEIREIEVLSRAGGQSPNDDRAGAHVSQSHGHAWVIDGATGVADRQYVPQAPSDAAWIAARYDDLFADLSQSSASLKDAFRRLIGRVRDDFRLATDSQPVPDHALPSAAALYCGWETVRGKTRLRFTGLGDCSAIIASDAGELRLIGDFKPGGGDARLLSHYPAFRGEQSEGAKRRLWDFLRERRAMMNRPDGYWVFSIEPDAAFHLEEHELDVVGPASLLMMSDGFARLIDHFEAYTPQSLVDAANRNGLKSLYQQLRALEADDADCRVYPRVKAEDDASALLVRIG